MKLMKITLKAYQGFLICFVFIIFWFLIDWGGVFLKMKWLCIVAFFGGVLAVLGAGFFWFGIFLTYVKAILVLFKNIWTTVKSALRKKKIKS